jgi:hypothetical protein
LSGFLSKLLLACGSNEKAEMWITVQSTGEKRCRKKNFLEPSFAFYFAEETDGNIPSTTKN